MTDYAQPRPQDFNLLYANHQLGIPPYHSDNSFNYMAGNTQLQYSTMNTSYPTYSQNYVSNQPPGSPSPPAPISYIPPCTHPPLSYHVQPPPRRGSIPLQSRMISHCPYLPPMLEVQNGTYHQSYLRSSHDLILNTEEQESVNVHSRQSEPIEPPLTGYPSAEEFDEMIKIYVSQLSPKKQDKALIHAKRAANIKAVLIDKKTTAVESAQFRFWVKKMFTLLPNDPHLHHRHKKICHEGKPVAIREKLFKILSRAHQKCQHGGRDKTSAQVRKVYSWVPKELISRFVKLCPTCQIRRGPKQSISPEDNNTPPGYYDNSPPSVESTPGVSRRTSTAPIYASNSQLPMHFVGGSAVFQNQNRWMMAPQEPVGDPMETDGEIQNAGQHCQHDFMNRREHDTRFFSAYDQPPYNYRYGNESAERHSIKRET